MRTTDKSVVLTIACSSGREAAAGQLADRIVAAWPAHAPRPTARIVPLASLVSQLEAAEGTDALPSGPVLALLDPAVADHAAYQLADELARWSLPGMLIFDVLTPARCELEAGGVLVAAGSTNAASLAAAVHALAMRQTTVRALSRDLAIAAKAQGGLGGQMDRIHDELNLAALVQQETLPKAMPRVAGIDCAAMMRPAGYVSGDVYDVAAIDGHRIVFFIADAVGHGVPAALMTMVISRAMRIDHPGDFVSPAATLSGLNDELCRGQRESGRFTTAVYGVIDAGTRRVTMASAGHPPPVLVGPEGMTRVPTDGALLGVFPGEVYEDVTFELRAGETLLMFSDGFEMAFESAEAGGRRKTRSADDEFEHYVQRLGGVRWPDGHGRRTAAESIEELMRLVDEQTGSLHQIDDLTAIAISAMHVNAGAPEREGALAA